jgi:hypothetical protein
VKNTGFIPPTPLKNGGIFIILPELSIAETGFLGFGRGKNRVRSLLPKKSGFSLRLSKKPGFLTLSLLENKTYDRNPVSGVWGKGKIGCDVDRNNDNDFLCIQTHLFPQNIDKNQSVLEVHK